MNFYCLFGIDGCCWFRKLDRIVVLMMEWFLICLWGGDSEICKFFMIGDEVRIWLVILFDENKFVFLIGDNVVCGFNINCFMV